MTADDLLARLRSGPAGLMYDRMRAFPSEVEESFARARAWDTPVPRGVENVVLCGMGGSSIGGRIARDFLTDHLTIPASVSRGYLLPGYTGEKSLVVVSSYSGDTEETVSSFEDALRRGARIVALSTGGEVARIAGRHGVPLFPLPAGYQPREALAPMLLFVVRLLSAWCRDLDLESEVAGAVEVLGRLCPELADPDGGSEALAVARSLAGTLPVIYASSPHLGGVADRWRSQLAENSEVLSIVNLLPEMNHNEIMGWGGESPRVPLSVLFLDDPRAHPRIRLRWKCTRELIEPRAASVTEIAAFGTGLFARMLSLICKGDFVSLYHSCLRGIDPAAIANIRLLKDRLSGER
jgi:glucose/mannose-6-phosphate isomerase